LAKVELALVKGKKNYDKREDLKKKDAQRDVQRTLRESSKV
jgi:SsrA-binding protein